MVKLKNLFQALLLVLLFVLPGCRRVEYRTVQPENPNMKYLLFSAESYKNTLNRAIIVSGEELYSKGEISYYAGDREVWAEKSNFTLVPGAQQLDRINQLNAEIVKWAKNTDYRRIEFAKANDCLELVIVYKNGRKVCYRYKISGAHTVSTAELGTEKFF